MNRGGTSLTCKNCKQTKGDDGLQNCPSCLAENRARKLRWLAKQDEASLLALRTKARDRRRADVAAGRIIYDKEARQRKTERAKVEGRCVTCGRSDTEIPDGTVTCLPCRAKVSQWYKTDKGQVRKKEWYQRWRESNPERNKQLGRNSNFARKRRVIEKYGGFCACCGEHGLEFLTIDHINEDGHIDRKTLDVGHGGSRFYQHLLNVDVRDDLQVLCWNCNLAKHHYSVCPHQRFKIVTQLEPIQEVAS